MSVIWHHGAWNRNFGDWVLFDSIQHHLRAAAKRDLYFLPLDSQRTVWRRELIDKMNAEADLFVIGGGGLIFNRPEDHSVSGWQFNILQEDLARIEVPIVVYGIGYNRFPYDRNDFPPVLDTHLRAVQERAALFSVRNPGPRREVVRRGLDPAKVRVVTDAGAFAPCMPVEIPGLDRARPVIGLNVAGDRPQHRFPGSTASPDDEERRAYAMLADALAQVAAEENAQVLFLPHLLEIDESPREIFRARLGANLICLKESLPQLYPPAAATASFLVGAYDQCDVVIGMRGHACLLPYGRKVPFLALGSHAKTGFLLEDIGLPNRRISTDRLLDGSLTVAQTAALIREAMHDDAARAHQAAALDAARIEFDAWNRDVAALISKP